jgi:hypothetical protein
MRFPGAMPGVGNGVGVIEKDDQGQHCAVIAESVASGWNTWDLSSNTQLPPRWTEDVTAIDESALRSRVLDAARQLKADVLLNLVEANQIAPSVASIAGSLPKMAANWKKIREVLRTASGAYLAWKFGISPILSDIMSIQRFWPKLKASVKRHGDMELSRFSAQAVTKMSLVSNPYVSYYPIGGVDCLAQTWQGRVLKTPQIRYVLVVKPTTKYHSSVFKTADAVMSRFSTSPASLAWELVPFSFVVDWFVDVRGALSAVDNLLGYSPYEIHSFTRSHSYAVAADATLDVKSPCGGVLNRFSCTVECNHYDRSLASGSAMPNWTPRFGKNQAAISVALITQALARTGTNRVIKR